MNRRDFIAAAATVAAAPAIGQTREVRIGCGYDPSSDELIHETFSIERWNGSEWIDTHERRTWFYQHGEKVEKRYKLTAIDLAFLKTGATP